MTDESGWWRDEHLRMLQPNLRETDADLPVEDVFAVVDRFHANALLLNTGGVCAFYPTDLSHHPRARPLEDRVDGDLTGTVLERCQREEVRFVARFDFSKFHESIYADRPSWAYRDANGEHVNYDGVVHACINGEYQQEYAFEILEEALGRYPVDGIFFNMFGYVEHDYDGTYHGPCHCENCQKRFRAFTGTDEPLPPKGYDPADHPEYRRFQRETASELLDRVRQLVDRIGADREEDIAVATYSERATHAVTDESNTGVDRQLPRWQYSAVDNVASIEDSWGKPAWNIVINAVDIPYRFQGVSGADIRTRLYGALLRGGGLAYCVNGPFSQYPDPSNFPAVESAYHIAATHSDTFQAVEPIADVGLVRPAHGGATPEYRGWFRALAESHMQFHVRTEASLGNENARPLVDDGSPRYDVLILPGTRLGDSEARNALSQARDAGTALLGTGARLGAEAPTFLASEFGVNRRTIETDVRGAYLSVGEDTRFPSLEETDLIAIDHAFASVVPVDEADSESGLPFVTPGTFGPPERVGRDGLDQTDEPGLVHRRPTAGGDVTYCPWGPGRFYHRHGFDTHGAVLTDVLAYARTTPRCLETNAPSTVEIALGTIGEDHLLQVLNRGGFTGTSYHTPAPLVDLQIDVADITGSPGVLSHDSPGAPSAEAPEVTAEYRDGGGIALTLDRLGTYVAIGIE